MILINIETGKELKVGDEVLTFRGETATLEGVHPPQTINSSGHVTIKLALRQFSMRYYPAVIGAKFVEEPSGEA